MPTLQYNDAFHALEILIQTNPSHFPGICVSLLPQYKNKTKPKFTMYLRPDGMNINMETSYMTSAHGCFYRCRGAKGEAVPRLAVREDSPADCLRRQTFVLNGFDSTSLHTTIDFITLLKSTFDSIEHCCIPIICL